MPGPSMQLQLDVAHLRQQRQLVPWASKQPVAFGRYSPFCINFLGGWVGVWVGG
jgi:hypothetical protein